MKLNTAELHQFEQMEEEKKKEKGKEKELYTYEQMELIAKALDFNGSTGVAKTYKEFGSFANAHKAAIQSVNDWKVLQEQQQIRAEQVQLQKHEAYEKLEAKLISAVTTHPVFVEFFNTKDDEGNMLFSEMNTNEVATQIENITRQATRRIIKLLDGKSSTSVSRGDGTRSPRNKPTSYKFLNKTTMATSYSAITQKVLKQLHDTHTNDFYQKLEAVNAQTVYISTNRSAFTQTSAKIKENPYIPGVYMNHTLSTKNFKTLIDKLIGAFGYPKDAITIVSE